MELRERKRKDKYDSERVRERAHTKIYIRDSATVREWDV